MAVLGASGAGKTTLLAMVNGLLEQDSGEVLFDGVPVDDIPTHHRDVTVVFQNSRLFPHMNVLENVAFPLKMRNVEKGRRAELASRMLDRVQLGGMGARGVRELSGGQRQRVALARALVADPKAVLLDEPFSGLDESLRDDMRRLVCGLQEQLGVTMLLVTHDPMEALTMGHRAAYMVQGAVVQEGDPAELLLAPATPEVAGCFGSTQALEGRVERGDFVCGRLRVPLCRTAVPGEGLSDGPAVLLRTSDATVGVYARGGADRADRGRTVSERSCAARAAAVHASAGDALAEGTSAGSASVEPARDQCPPPAAVPALADLQAYVDSCDALHDAVGAPRGMHLPLRPFARGEYNANYAFNLDADQVPHAPVRRLLLRVNLGSQMHLDDQIGYEMNALRVLEPCGRTPRALFVDGSRTVLPCGVGVEERLAGRPLRYETDLARAARILADVHALPVSSGCGLAAPRHPLAGIVAECAQMFAAYRAWDGADAAVLTRVERMFETAERLAGQDRMRPEPAVRHVVNTEVNSGNFLINENGRSYLVDWEKPVLGEVEQDLGHFLAPTTTFWKTDTVLGDEQVAEFLDAYRRAVDGRFSLEGMEDRLRSYMAVTCLRGVTWCAMALAEHRQGVRSVADAATLAKVEAYLGAGFLEGVGRAHYGWC